MNGSGEISHTGIVEKISGGKVYTIEGNSDGMVTRHHYLTGNARIYGYGHPDWDIVKDDGKESGESEEKGKTMERNAKVVPTSTSTGSTVNLRSQASTSGKILAKVPFESPVMVVEDLGDWCKVTWNGITGWMMANYIEYTDVSDDEDDSKDGYQVVLSLDEINAIEEALKELEEIRGEIDNIVETIGMIVGRG